MRSILIQVSIIESQIILFINSPSHNLRPVEHFLQKRGFRVYFETEVKMASIKLVELKPNFIFLAWDHPNQKITELPEIIARTNQCFVIPYIMSYSKDDERRLQACNLNPKLFPPVSGPSIERLISKHAKVSIKKNSDYDEIVNKYKIEKEKNPDSANEINSGVASEQKIVPGLQGSIITEPKPVKNPGFILIKYQNLKKRNEFLIQFKKKNLPGGISSELKESLPEKIQLPIEKLMPAGDAINSVRINYRAYCFSIFSTDWCGYLSIFSKQTLDQYEMKNLITTWVEQNFKTLLEPDENDFIVIPEVEPETISELSKGSDFFEVLNIQNQEVLLSFFSIDPEKLNVEFNGECSLIKIPTEQIPTERELNFSLHLHLPENKKFIVYTQANKKLSLEQKNRLLTNKIALLYTPIEFENEYKKFLTEKNLREFCLALVKKSAV